MKFTRFILLFLLVSQITLSVQNTIFMTRSRFQGRRYRRASKSKGPANNKWYNLAMGVLGELAGGNHVAIQSCLPDSWKTEKGEEGGDAAAPVTSSGNVLQTVLNIVGKIIGMFCKVKDWVKKLLGMKLYRRFGLKYSFVMRTMRRWGWLRNIWNKVKNVAKKVFNTVKSVAKKVVEGVKTVAKKVVEGVKTAVNWVIEQAKKVVKGIIGAITKVWSGFVNKIKSIFNSPIVQKILEIFKCLTNLVGPAMEIVGLIKSIIGRVRNIMALGPLAIIDILIDLICNFTHFKAAIEFLIAGIREGNQIKKFNLIGKFIGRILYALIKTRRLKKYYFRVKLVRLKLRRLK